MIQWSVQWSGQCSNGLSNDAMVGPIVQLSVECSAVGPLLQWSVPWPNEWSNCPMLIPVVQWSVTCSNGRSNGRFNCPMAGSMVPMGGPMVGPMVEWLVDISGPTSQWLVQFSKARLNGPTVALKVHCSVQWSNGWSKTALSPANPRSTNSSFLNSVQPL